MRVEAILKEAAYDLERAVVSFLGTKLEFKPDIVWWGGIIIILFKYVYTCVKVHICNVYNTIENLRSTNLVALQFF